MEDIYKTPEAELIVANPAGMDFYVVAKSKYVLLFILTCSLYAYYWFYKNWQLQKLKTGESIRPVWRSIFAIFFIHSLLQRVDIKKNKLEIATPWHPDLLAGLYIFIIIISAVTDRLSANSIGSPYTDFMFIPLLFMECYVLLKAQEVINIVCRDAEGNANRRFTPINIIFMVLGTCFWLLILVGLITLFYPEAFMEPG